MTKKRQGVSVFAFAKAIGVSDNAVRDRIKRGSLADAVFDDGSLDEEKARVLWFANANPNRMRAAKEKKPAAAEQAEQGRSEFELKLDRMEVDLDAARLNLEKLRGSTVDKEAARRAVRQFARNHRDHMLRFAARHGPAIAADLGVDAAALVSLLEARIRDALVEASENPIPFDDGPQPEPAVDA